MRFTQVAIAIIVSYATATTPSSSRCAFITPTSSMMQQRNILPKTSTTAAFISAKQQCHHQSTTTSLKMVSPTKVTDEDGLTPDQEEGELKLINPDDIPGMHYDENVHPIPHQPWRRGDTDGCEDPIEAPWRQEAEMLIKNAAMAVGGNVVDVTWYMSNVMISVDPDLSNVEQYSTGPPIQVEYPDDNPYPLWEDPEDDGTNYFDKFNPETGVEIIDPDAPPPQEIYDPNTGRPQKPPPPKVWDEVSAFQDYDDEEIIRMETAPRQEKPDGDKNFAHSVDTHALSTIARAILESLEDPDVEDRLRVCERHEVILTSPSLDPTIIESQTQFDDARGLDVLVYTQDPWNSNRVLRGKLVERNALDVIINMEGRMVTVPQNMIHEVKRPKGYTKPPPGGKAKRGPITDGEGGNGYWYDVNEDGDEEFEEFDDLDTDDEGEFE